MIHKVVVIEEDKGLPVLQIDNKNSKFKINIADLSGVIEAINVTIKSLVDSQERVQKMSFRTFTILAERCKEKPYTVIVIADSDSRVNYQRLRQMVEIIDKSTHIDSDETKDKLIEILSEKTFLEELKDWGEKLWT